MITDLLSRVIEQNQPEQCILSGYEEYKFTPQGKAYTVATVTQQGRVAKIKIYQGSGLRLTPDKIGQNLAFNLKSYAAQNGKIYISGFWNDKAGAGSPPTTYQNAPQSTNSTQAKTTGQEMLEVLYMILTAIKDLQLSPVEQFKKEYNLNGDAPIDEIPPDDTDEPIPF